MFLLVIDAHSKWLDAYFFANTITGNEAEEKKRAILLTSIAHLHPLTNVPT